MCIVVHWVDRPLIASLVMFDMANAINHRVTHVDIGRCHVDPGTQTMGAIRKFTCTHARKQIHILFHTAAAVRTLLARTREIAAIFARLLRRKAADIGLACTDQLQCKLVECIEIGRRIADLAAPGKSKPLNIGFDGIDELLTFLLWIGVIEAQIAAAIVCLCSAEIQTDGLGVTDMQEAIGFWWKTRLHSPRMLAALQVLLNNVANEVGRHRRSSACRARISGIV